MSSDAHVPEPPFPNLVIAEVLDKSTVVLTGENVELLHLDDDLVVLAVGGIVRGTSVPLVLPKAELVVTSVSSIYVVARTKVRVTQEPSPLSAMIIAGAGSRTVRTQEVLSVDDSILKGNPASSPVLIGDPVVRRSDIPKFIEQKAKMLLDE